MIENNVNLDRYSILSILGQGSYGIVKLARDKWTEKYIIRIN